MTIDVIGIGAAPGDNTGDGLRTAMTKVNNNFGSSANAASKLIGITTGQIPLAEDGWNDGTVEYGTNANGEFWKYPDGKLICTGVINITGTSWSSGGGKLFSAESTATFPANFNATPKATGGLVDTQISSRGAWLAFLSATTTTSVVAYAASVSSSTGTADMTVNYMAIGTWQ
tara:strand:+ start:2195 stop:2713 length:519 start_codon:yes stop_codon:yes gene_type:complete